MISGDITKLSCVRNFRKYPGFRYQTLEEVYAAARKYADINKWVFEKIDLLHADTYLVTVDEKEESTDEAVDKLLATDWHFYFDWQRRLYWLNRIGEGYVKPEGGGGA